MLYNHAPDTDVINNNVFSFRLTAIAFSYMYYLLINLWFNLPYIQSCIKYSCVLSKFIKGVDL